MRSLLLVVGLGFAACAVAPHADPSSTLLGSYRMNDCSDAWLELRLLGDGTCACSSVHTAGGGLRADYSGRWQVQRDVVTLELDHRYGDWFGPRTLHVLRRDGFVYLVPRADVALFEAHGPLHDACFHRDGAPLEVWRRGARAE